MGDLDSLLAGSTKALVWGIGGGNDALNALPVLVQLAQRGITCDLAGSLNPSHHHYFEDGPEQVVNRLTANATRHINDKEQKRIPFVDCALVKLLPDLDLCQGIPAFSMLSCKKGSNGLAIGLEHLVYEAGYDLVVGVDTGGDVSCRGARDARVLSPLIDAMALYALAKVHNAKALLVQQGFGTDGELTLTSQHEIMHRWKSSIPPELLAESELLPGTPEVAAYHNAFAATRKVREGNTTRRTLKGIYDRTGIGFSEKHDLRAKIGDLRITASYDVYMSPAFFGKQYWLDPEIQARHNPLARQCFSPLELAMQAKFIHGLHTDLDVQHVWSGEGGDVSLHERSGGMFNTLVPGQGKLLQFMALQDPEPVPGVRWLSPEQRNMMLQYAAMRLAQGKTDMVLTKRADAGVFPSCVDVLLHDDYAIASHPHARHARDVLAMLMRHSLGGR